MVVKVQIFATKGEYEERKADFEEFNDEVYTPEMFQKDCVDDFFADRSDYLDPDNCEVFVLGDPNECIE